MDYDTDDNASETDAENEETDFKLVFLVKLLRTIQVILTL